jgi:hypothetical protein
MKRIQAFMEVLRRAARTQMTMGSKKRIKMTVRGVPEVKMKCILTRE